MRSVFGEPVSDLKEELVPRGADLELYHAV